MTTDLKRSQTNLEWPAREAFWRSDTTRRSEPNLECLDTTPSSLLGERVCLNVATAFQKMEYRDHNAQVLG